MPEVALPPERTISPGSCWAGASPKEESGTLAGEAALGHVLAVPGQLLPTADLPRDTPAPPSGPTLRRQPHQLWRGPLYVHCRGVGTALADNYAGHYLVLEKGPVLNLASWRVKMLQLGLKWVDANQSLKSAKKPECAEKRAHAHVTQKINKTRKK